MYLTKSKLALAIIAFVVVSTSAAFAGSVFSDVDDSRFYAEAAAWAKDNGITTGCGDGTTFCPEDPVTRGENVTFAKRYDDNIVQPALEDVDNRLDIAEADIDAAQASISGMPSVHTAWIGSTGLLLRSSDGVSVTTSGTGSYTVAFPADVTDCSWQVNHRTQNGIAIFDPSNTFEPEFSLATRASGIFPNQTVFPAEVVVTVTDQAGADANTSFDIAAICA